jgi:hypothetical protein
MSLTPKQRDEINKYLDTTMWDHIYDNILTEEQRKDERTMRNIAFEMEDILKTLAAWFGLSALGDDQ